MTAATPYVAQKCEFVPDLAYTWRPYANPKLIIRPIEQRDALFVIDPWTQRWAIVTPLAVRLLQESRGRKRLAEIARDLAQDRDVPLDANGISALAAELAEEGLLFATEEEHRASGLPVYNKSDLIGFHLEITNACNMTCEHCYVSSGRKMPNELTFEEICRTIDMLPAFSGKRIALSGGEPAVRKDCGDIIEYCAVTCGHDVDVYTNGKKFPRALSERIRAVNARGLGNVRIQMSLEGATAETNDFVRGAGSFAYAMESLRAWQELGLGQAVVLFVCVTKHNIAEIDALIRIAEKHDVGMLVFSQWQKQGNAQNTPWAAIAPPTDEWVAAGEKLLQYSNPRLRVFGNFFGDLNNNEYGRYSLDRPLFPKHIYFYNAFPRITPVGDVFADQLWVDESWILGNVREMSLDACFESPKFYMQLSEMRLRTAVIQECRDCDWVELCQGGSPGHTYAEYGSMNEKDLFCESRIRWFQRYVEHQVRRTFAA